MINSKSVIRIFVAAFFAAAISHGHVEIAAPKGGEMLNAGAAFTIKWTADDHDCVYNLYYSPDGGTIWQNIVLGLPKAARQHNWTVPALSTSKGMVRVFQDNATGSDLEGKSQVFMVHGSAGIAQVRTAGEPSMRFDAVSRSIEIVFPSEDGMDGKHVSLNAFNAQGRLVANLLDGTIAPNQKRMAVFSNRLQSSVPLVFKLQVGSHVYSHFWNGVR